MLVVPTDPWRYDPSVGAKETLIGEVLGALGSQIKETEGAAGKARALLTKLKNRVDWSKAIQVAAKASLAFQLPSVDDLTSLIKTDGGESGGRREPRPRRVPGGVPRADGAPRSWRTWRG